MTKIKLSKIIRSQRRSIGLQIAPDATLIIRAPFKVSDAYIDKIVAGKRSWITRKQEFVLKQRRLAPAKQFVTDEEFLYLGQAYKLYVNPSQSAPLVLDQAFNLAQACHSRARTEFIKWYKTRARTKLAERVNFYAARSGLRYQKVKISSARRRWGSCSRSGNLNLNWRLIMAPLDVLDYVVAHEVAHLEHPNHSRRFWNKVMELDPDYKSHRKWLRDHDHLLEF